MVEPEFKGLSKPTINFDDNQLENKAADSEFEYKSQQLIRALSDASNLDLSERTQQNLKMLTDAGMNKKHLMMRREFSEGPNLTTSMPHFNKMTRKKVFGAHSMNFDTLQNEIYSLQRDHQHQIEQLDT